MKEDKKEYQLVNKLWFLFRFDKLFRLLEGLLRKWPRLWRFLMWLRKGGVVGQIVCVLIVIALVVFTNGR